MLNVVDAVNVDVAPVTVASEVVVALLAGVSKSSVNEPSPREWYANSLLSPNANRNVLQNKHI